MNLNTIIKFLLFIALFIAAQGGVFAQFTIGGTAASIGNDCYRLTNALNSQAGYVYQNAPININEPFDYFISVYLGTNNGGADGIVFVLKDSLSAPFIGSGGGLLGFDGPGFDNSLGIEVDTWFNGGNADIGADHIGIVSKGSVVHSAPTGLAGPIQASVGNINVEDGAWHFFNVTWNPNTEVLKVYFDCEERLTYTGNLIDSIFNGDSTVHWGFIGTTGGANNLQQFCLTVPLDSLVTSLSDTSICAGEAVQFNAGTNVPTYLWNNGSSLSSTTIPNPVATPTTTTTYSVTATYACDTLVDTAMVSIIPPGFSLSSTVNEPDCFGDCNGGIDLTVSGSGTYNYAWNTGPVTEDLNGLCQGTYSVTVSENSGCTLSDTIDVNEPSQLQASIVNASKTSCPGVTSCDASAEVQASGGTSPYSFLWSSGEDSAVAVALCPDSNFVTVTDANGCMVIVGEDIDVPDSIATFGNGDTLICLSQSAVITAASTGGTPPFSYSWFEGTLGGNLVAGTQSVNVSPPSTQVYIVQSTDSNGCVGDTSKVTVRVRQALRTVIPKPDTICPYDTIPITATGYGGDGNYNFSWSSGHLGATATVSPDLSQWYFLTLTDVCGSPAHKDSVFVQVGGYSPIKATIRANEDSICLGKETFLVASGRGGHRGPAEYQYQWRHTALNDDLLFIRPAKTRDFAVTITDLCLSEGGVDTITIHVNDLKAPSILTQPALACARADVAITLSQWFPNYRYDWKFSDGHRFNAHTDSLLTHSFEDQGCYDAWLHVADGFGCEVDVFQSCIVEILEQPIAAFTSDKLSASSLDPQLIYRDASLAAESITWIIEFDTILNEDIVIREVRSPWGQDVKLIAEAASGCTDTTLRHFDFVNDFTIYIPNSFTPNGDGVNDVFEVKGEVIDHDGFLLAVYDRWGSQLFLSTNPNHGWDGKSVTGARAPIGVYTVVLEYIDGTKTKRRTVQTITLAKTNEQKF